MKITIIAIGKCKKNSPEAEIIAEYVKRSAWQITIKEADNSNQAEEARFLQGAIPSGAKVIVLDERGENLKSMELARKIENWQLNGCSEICFLIGGADGHLPETRQRGRFGRTNLPDPNNYQPSSLSSGINFLQIDPSPAGCAARLPRRSSPGTLFFYRPPRAFFSSLYPRASFFLCHPRA